MCKVADPYETQQHRYSPDGMRDERITVVRALADAITERDVEAALELCHPEDRSFSPCWHSSRRAPTAGSRALAGISRTSTRRGRNGESRSSSWYPGPDGCVVIVMSTHMRGKGSGLPFAERVANLWEFKDEKLWRATLYRDPADALRATGAPRPEN